MKLPDNPLNKEKSKRWEKIIAINIKAYLTLQFLNFMTQIKKEIKSKQKDTSVENVRRREIKR